MYFEIHVFKKLIYNKNTFKTLKHGGNLLCNCDSVSNSGSPGGIKRRNEYSFENN